METVRGRFADGDILFLLATVMPERGDLERAVGMMRDDAEFVEALLGDERVFRRLVGDEETVLKVSPRLFFSVLLRRARRDLGAAPYTLERRQGQRVAVFDSRQAAGLLAQPHLRDYLADMLVSFVRVRGVTWRVRVRKGVWRKQRFNDLDVDSLIGYASTVAEEQRFEVYKRIADVCLFLAGVFPEYVASQERYPFGQAPGPGRGRSRRGIEDYEREGRAFYRLAAGHRAARAAELSAPLSALAEHFTLAEKPLTFLSEHYLRLRKRALFGL